MKSHKDLDVWRLSMDLAVDVYEVTRTFPREEQFGMTSQMRRSANSVPMNISEGAARQSDKEFVQFLHYALGSVSELDTQLEIAKRVNLAPPETLEKLQNMGMRINQMLRGLVNSLRNEA